MKKPEKLLVLFLAVCFVFAAAGGASVTAMADEDDFYGFEDFDFEDLGDWEFGDWEFEDDLDWIFDEGEEEYSSETLEDGSLVETCTTTYESGDVQVESVTTSPDGNIMREVFRVEGADGYVYSSEWEYTYDGDGFLISGKGVETEFYPDDEASNVTQVTVNTYDEMGSILTSNIEFSYASGYVYTEEWEYTYDGDGMCVSDVCHAKEINEDGAEMEMEAEETYDADGNLLTQSTRYIYDDGTESTESWKYTYNEEGCCVSGECEGSDTYPGEGTVTRTVSETYNENGYILTQHIEYTYPEDDA